MASAGPVHPDTLVTVKVSLDGEFRRFKLPLKDLGPSIFPSKMRTLLAIPPDHSIVLERYSDSAASFVLLQSSDVAVYKQLLRAAKAKLKLRIRATCIDIAPHELAPVSPLPPAAVMQSVRLPPPAPAPAPAPALVSAPAPAAPVTTASDVQNLFQAAEQASREPPVSMLNKLNTDHAAPPSLPHPPAVGMVCRRHSRALGMAPFSVSCNVCSADIPRVHWHCSICHNGDYDLCSNCVDLGHHCEVDSHFLIKRIIENGQVINATHETISKKFGTSSEALKPSVKTEPEPVALEQVQEPKEQHRRTCNNCIQVLDETEILTCTTCEDFDLCAPCLRAMKHGHHPAHGFERVDGTMPLNSRLTALLCAPGRNKYHHAICDGCNLKVRGIRHKCFECPDFDLCDHCIIDVQTLHPGHRFAPLYDTIGVPQVNHAEHHGVSCDGPLCKSKSRLVYIRGVRYKCAVCYDTDFCDACEASPLNEHNRTHPLIKFRTAVARVAVTTIEDAERGAAATIMGDQPPATSSKATETNAPVHAATQVQTVAECKPLERAKEAAALESQRASPALPYHGVFVADVIPDGSKMPAAQVFCQTWTIKNPGPTAWPQGCCLRFVGGDRMLNMDAENPASTDELDRAISSNIIDREVLPGETVKFAVVLKAPTRTGTAISYWRIKTPDGLAFGHKLWCEIDVTPATSRAPSPLPPASAAPPVGSTNLAMLLQEKSEAIYRLSADIAQLREQIKQAHLDRDAALSHAQGTMHEQRAELLAKLEEVTAKSERMSASQTSLRPSEKENEPAISTRVSQMIFPKLEKESPEASVYENARQDFQAESEPATVPNEAELVDDMESLVIDDASSDEGFLTDEEYDLLDNEFDEIMSAKK